MLKPGMTVRSIGGSSRCEVVSVAQPPATLHLKDEHGRVFQSTGSRWISDEPAPVRLERTREDILTRSGQYFDFLHPERYRIEITDIAHALAHTCRFAGHCREFYSVAQHSVYVSRIVPPEDAFAGLMHDCAEAFIGDVSRPLKRMLAEYRAIEKHIEAVLFAGLGLPAKLPASVKLADRQLLYSEQAALMPPHDDEWAVLEGIAPAPGIIISPLWPDEAYAAFMERYCELRPSTL